MGSYIGKPIADNMQKNQEKMLERQMQMQNIMREKAMAMQLAKAKDMLHWWLAAYTTFFVAGVAGFKRVRHPGPLAPLLPLTFIVLYQADLVYGDKMDRIREEADRILREEMGTLAIPQGLPTIEDLDERRAK